MYVVLLCILELLQHLHLVSIVLAVLRHGVRDCTKKQRRGRGWAGC